MVTANNYTFRPLTGHHQVVHPTKRGWGCTIYNVTSVWWSDGSYIVYCTTPTPFHWMYNLIMAC